MAITAIAGAADAAPGSASHEHVLRRWKSSRPRQNGAAAGGGAVYGLGMMGALVYYGRSAVSGWDYVLAVPKASIWPALLVYKLLQSFHG